MYPSQTLSIFKKLSVIGLFLTAAWINPAFSANDQGADAEALTKSLAGLNNAYQKAAAGAKSQALQQLIESAAERQALLVKLIKTDPASVLRTAIPTRVRARMPAEVQVYIEQRLEIEGELEVTYEDYADGSHRLRHALKVNGEHLSLHFESPPTGLLSSTPALVSGVLVDHAMAVESGEDDLLVLALDGAADGVSISGAAAPVPNTLGEQRVLVMLVNFQDNPIEPYTPQYARDVIFGETSDFFFENSFGQTWLTGDVTNWFTIAVDSTVCDTINTRAYAEEAATNAGYNLINYSRLVYAFPKNACAFWGSAGVGGNPSRASLNGDLELAVTGHELGHNLGLLHAHSLVCDDGTVLGSGSAAAGSQPWPNCSNLEYGDGIDIMGWSPSAHFSAYQKERLGWLNHGSSPAIEQIDSDGIYHISPYSSPDDGSPKALKILKAVSATGYNTWYYLEYRQPTGFDSFLATNFSGLDVSNVMNGITTHVAYDGNGGNSLYLLDMTPETNIDPYTRDPALVTGRTFLGPDGVTITTDWTDTNGALVRVTLAAPTCVPNNPAVTLSPSTSPWVEAGTAVTFTATITNRDNNACAAATFDLTANIPNGWTASFANPSITLDPGSNNTTSFVVTSSTTAPDNFYTVTVNAENSANPAYVSSSQVTYVVSNPIANQAPVAIDDQASTAQDTEVLIAVLANDSDPDGDQLTLTSVAQGANGHASVNSNGSLVYMPAAGFSGTGHFSYSISDGNNGNASADVIVEVVAAPSNNPPVALNDSVTIQTIGSVKINVSANDSDSDGDELTLVSVTQGSKGTVTINADESVTYTPGKRFKNSDNFTYTITDGISNATATVTVNLQKSPGGKGGGKPAR